ncbi:hypothetical protein ON010_g9687 [Phytophthora cinnamomi]|nr:hypothetical protein ON010_g9687 [Phytophthora cinnamomi]
MGHFSAFGASSPPNYPTPGCGLAGRTTPRSGCSSKILPISGLRGKSRTRRGSIPVPPGLRVKDRLFEPTIPDDINIGADDWLLSVDSDADGDEDSILLDEAFDGEDNLPVDEKPVEFHLSDEALDRLQHEEWEMFDERKSHGVMKVAAPRYEGPTGPTRAALAYAEKPLAIFYFFLPKELWGKIADETDQYRRDSIDEVARGMRARAQHKRVSMPSTIVLSVNEYKVKLQRKNSIQPHEIVRFIGLLIARTLEPRRESPSRHWVTKVEGALGRGTFGQFLSRDRFHDILFLARYLHFNKNGLQAESGDRAFKIHPVVQALQKTFFSGFRLGARISFDEGMVPMRHSTKPNAAVHAYEAKQVGDQVLRGMLLDIYCGKANLDEESVAQRAVVTSLTHVLRGQPTQRLICTDNFYTSIPLSHKRLRMGHYHIGTIRKNRKAKATTVLHSTLHQNAQVLQEYILRASGHRYGQRLYHTQASYEATKQPVPTHAASMRRLHVDLLNQGSDDFVAGDDLADLVTEPLPNRRTR